MKPEELMIGDWVLHDGEPYQIRQLGIYGENRDGEDYPAVCVGKPKGIGLIVERNEIVPIPLTPEILEKNGFKECTNEDWTNDNVDFIFYRRMDGIFRIQNTNMTLPYVSSFQHALRMCGINKEINI